MGWHPEWLYGGVQSAKRALEHISPTFAVGDNAYAHTERGRVLALVKIAYALIEAAFNVEPHARQYRCPACEQYQVYGAEKILMMGMVEE